MKMYKCMEVIVNVHQKARNRTTLWLNLIVLGIYSQLSVLYNKDYCPSVFVADLFTTARKWNYRRHPLIDEWIKKTWYICTVTFWLQRKLKHEIFRSVYEIGKTILRELERGRMNIFPIWILDTNVLLLLFKLSCL